MNELLTRTSLSNVSARAWAYGCGVCEFGVLPTSEPLPHPLPVNLGTWQIRLNQWRAGKLQLCECKAGQMLRKRLTVLDSTVRDDKVEIEQARAEYESRRLLRLFEDAAVPPKYAGYTFKSFLALANGDGGKQAAIAAVRSYFQDGAVEQNGGRKTGLLFYGPTGVGKTGILSPLFTNYLQAGKTGLWVQYNELMAQLRDFESGQVDERMAACKRVDYLFVDDFGDPASERTASPWAQDCMFRIIDHRVNHFLPMLITSNLDLGQISDQFHQRLTRRLVESCAVVSVGGRALRG
jgi:DNA replication protein DnaC